MEAIFPLLWCGDFYFVLLWKQPASVQSQAFCMSRGSWSRFPDLVIMFFSSTTGWQQYSDSLLLTVAKVSAHLVAVWWPYYDRHTYRPSWEFTSPIFQWCAKHLVSCIKSLSVLTQLNGFCLLELPLDYKDALAQVWSFMPCGENSTF